MRKRDARTAEAALFATAENPRKKHSQISCSTLTGTTFPVADSLEKQIFVGKAYEEPMGHDLVETILMQRDFIID